MGTREQLRDAHDAVHRRTQLMTHPVEEIAFRPRSLLELAIGLNQLAGSQGDLRFQALLLLDDAHEAGPLLARAMGNQAKRSERVSSVGPAGLPGRRVSVHSKAQRVPGPDAGGGGRSKTHA